jgi:hypothetical protein
MLAVYFAITHSLWITLLGFFAIGWGFPLVAYLLSRSRARKSAERYRQQMQDLASQVEHHERQHDENRGILREVRRDLVDARARCTDLESQLGSQQQSAPMVQGRPAKGSLPQAVSLSPLAPAPEANASKWSKLEEDLSELRRTRDLAEQRAEALRAANQDQMRKNAAMAARLEELAVAVEEASERASEGLRREIEAAAANQNALTHQLEEKTLAYGAVERMLQDSTATQLQLRRDLQAMAQDREQLEQQNLELKQVLDQMGDSAIAVQQVPPVSHQSRNSPTHLELRANQDWETVTESDIHQAIVGVTEKARPVPAVAKPAPARVEASMSELEYLREQNTRLSDESVQDRGAARELTTLQLEHKRLQLDLLLATEKLVAQTKKAEHLGALNAELQQLKTEQEVVTQLNQQVRELDAENVVLRNVNSGTFTVAPPVASESRELSVAPLDSAVLSDNLGLAIACTGNVSSESLAAVSGLALSNSERVRELLPVGPIATVQWVDQYGMTVTCKLLNISGDEMAMTTFGAGTPSEEALRVTLRTILASIGWNEKGPIPDHESHVATG